MGIIPPESAPCSPRESSKIFHYSTSCIVVHHVYSKSSINHHHVTATHTALFKKKVIFPLWSIYEGGNVYLGIFIHFCYYNCTWTINTTIIPVLTIHNPQYNVFITKEVTKRKILFSFLSVNYVKQNL